MKNNTLSHRTRLLCAICVVVLMASACSGCKKVRLIVQPEDAKVTVVNARGVTVWPRANRPATVGPIDIGADQIGTAGPFKITVAKAGYETFTRSYDKAGYLRLPASARSADIRVLTINLARKVPVSIATTEAAGASIEVTNQWGAEVGKGPAPLETDLLFAGTRGYKTYTVKVTAPGYEERKVVYNRQTVEGYSIGTSARRQIRIDLNKWIGVRFISDPEDAKVQVTAQANGKVTDLSNSKWNLLFGKDIKRYTINVTHEDYIPAKFQLSESELSANSVPVDGVVVEQPEGGLWVVRTRLRGKSFVDRKQMVMLYDPKDGMVGRIKRVRAYLDVGEPSDVTVQVVHSLPEGVVGVRGLAMSPRGDQLSFAQAQLNEVDQGKIENSPVGEHVTVKECGVWSINIDRESGQIGAVQRVTQGNVDADPFLELPDPGKPDDTWMLVATNRFRDNTMDLVRMLATGRGRKYPLYRDLRGWAVLRPSVAAGNIVFELRSADPYGKVVGEIWSQDSEGAEAQIIEGKHPHISPDGDRIVYIGNDSNIWVVNTDGTEPGQLTDNAADITQRILKQLTEQEKQAGRQHPELYAAYAHPTWSYDGDYIVYTTREGKDNLGRYNENIGMMKPDGREVALLTENGSADLYPVVGPDNRTVYFFSNRTERWSIYRMEIE